MRSRSLNSFPRHVIQSLSEYAQKHVIEHQGETPFSASENLDDDLHALVDALESEEVTAMAEEWLRDGEDTDLANFGLTARYGVMNACKKVAVKELGLRGLPAMEAVRTQALQAQKRIMELGVHSQVRMTTLALLGASEWEAFGRGQEDSVTWDITSLVKSFCGGASTTCTFGRPNDTGKVIDAIEILFSSEAEGRGLSLSLILVATRND